jgi:hypothetical protein
VGLHDDVLGLGADSIHIFGSQPAPIKRIAGDGQAIDPVPDDQSLARSTTKRASVVVASS